MDDKIHCAKMTNLKIILNKKSLIVIIFLLFFFTELVCTKNDNNFFHALQASESEQSSPEESNNAALALAEKGNFPDAAAHLERAYTLSPNSAQITHNLSQVLFDWGLEFYKKGDFTSAGAKLEKAVENDSKNGPAWLVLGDIKYLRQNDFAAAIRCWKKALETVPDDKRIVIFDRIQKVGLDEKLERNFSTQSTAHFHIRSESIASPTELESLIALLESQHASLSAEFKNAPSKISVIVYPKGSFQRLSNRFEWAAGFYDGKIRIRAEDLGTDLLETIVRHEMAHAFINSAYSSNIPTWAHEGYAQLKEPSRPFSPEEVDMEKALRERTEWIPAEWLDRRFEQPIRSDDILRAYLEARILVSFCLERFGPDRFQDFLKALSEGSELPKAFDKVFSPAKWARVKQGQFD